MCEVGIPVNFDWKKYLDLAEDLAQNETDEAKLRASISRAYYAAFCNARNYMKCKDHNEFPPNAKEHHKYLAQYFRGESDESKTDIDGSRNKIGKYLNSMRHDRRKVDYDDYVSDLEKLKKTADEVLKRSRHVVLKIEQGGF
ncbi:MAG: hypothetical protein QG666_497 [Euryarchaeota archaeon]|nr:hypothetical protein [Euryarchaeota archaeon]